MRIDILVQNIDLYKKEYIDQYDGTNELKSIYTSFFSRWYVKFFYSVFRPKLYKRLKKELLHLNDCIKEWNEEYIKMQMIENKDYFFNMEGYSLDEQQQRAVITDDKYNLVLAGAGSGKTLTVAAKVKYLSEIKNVNPDEILLISFTKKAADEMTNRISVKMGIPIKASTFHAIGNKIIFNVEKKRLDISENMESIINNYFVKELPKSKELMHKVLSFIGLYLEGEDFLEQNKREIANEKQYTLYTIRSQYEPFIIEENIEKLKKILDKEVDQNVESKVSDKIERLKYKRKTILGERVKSIEEAKIANFLYLNGIDYEYEALYPYDLSDNYRKQYRPDFYLPQERCYWEHFGITEENRVPWLSEIEEKKYLDGIIWKRKIHYENGTKLVESYSYMNKNDKFEEKLIEIVKRNNFKIAPRDIKDIYLLLFVQKKNPSMDTFQELIATFIRLCKSNGYNEEWLKNIKKGNDLSKRDYLFLEIVHPIFSYYNEQLNMEKKSDFNDMINRAATYVENGSWIEKYRYIIIDEYQDISVGRYKLVKAIQQKTNAKLFCVGDDWQSIYRFTGSDIDLFSNFIKYWGKYQLLKIEKTYRNSQELINIASQFVQKNTAQLKKSLYSDMHCRKPLYEVPYAKVEKKHEDSKEYIVTASDALYVSLKKINSLQNGIETTVLLLGRYNLDITMLIERRIYDVETGQVVVFKDERYVLKAENGNMKIVCNDFPNLNIQFLTVHRAKGLEADYAIIINMHNDRTGFPNQIMDDPILRLVLSDADDYKYAEERRLFYVAITRTRNAVFLLVPINSESIFSYELRKDNSIEFFLPEELNVENINAIDCPRCKRGKLVIRSSKNGEFLGCTNYPSCKYTISDTSILENPTKCDCGGYMLHKKGVYGEFMGCSNFPYCKHTIKNKTHN